MTRSELMDMEQRLLSRVGVQKIEERTVVVIKSETIKALEGQSLELPQVNGKRVFAVTRAVQN